MAALSVQNLKSGQQKRIPASSAALLSIFLRQRLAETPPARAKVSAPSSRAARTDFFRKGAADRLLEGGGHVLGANGLALLPAVVQQVDDRGLNAGKAEIEGGLGR